MLASNMNRFLKTLILLPILAACSSVPEKPADSVSGFVSFALEEKFGYLLDGEGQLVIRDNVAMYTIEGLETRESFLREAESQGPKVLEAACDYWEKNQEERTVKDFGRLTPRHVVVGKGWGVMEFSEWYPKFEKVLEQYPYSPVIGMSYPGFSKDESIAIIYLGQTNGGRNGGGETIVFEKIAGVWRRSEFHVGMSWRG